MTTGVILFWYMLLIHVPCRSRSDGPVPDSKVHGANTGPIWGRHDPGEPHVGPMNFALGGVLNPVGLLVPDTTHLKYWC